MNTSISTPRKELDAMLKQIKHHAHMILEYPGQFDYEANEILTIIQSHYDAKRPKNTLGFPIPKTLDDLKRRKKP